VKRLIVCCDGTWNRPDHVDQGVAAPTNVAKFALGLAAGDGEGNPQVLHYEAGVGTRPAERLLGGGLGVGLSRNVQACYRFLVDAYEPGDELYFLGFSRGAFTARSTVGLVRNSGILLREHRHRVKEAYRLYRDPRRDTEPASIAARLFRRSFSNEPEAIQFVGVWDTVGALGIPIDGFRPPLLSRLWRFHDTKLSRSVRHAYHALAIDERRRPFRPTVWEQQSGARDQTVEQVWFAGVHCDVGGGYRDPALSEIPLLWMVEKARSCGLAFKPGHFVSQPGSEVSPERRAGIHVAPDALGELHDSRTRFYKLFPSFDRRLAGEDGADVAGGALASSARDRYDGDPAYRPPGLGEWIRAGKPVARLPGG
jgi:uncharacterized protein (DUF2235 family)